MKKTISVILLGLFGLCSAFADTVSRSEAQKYAEQFFGAPAAFVWDGQEVLTKGAVREPAFHVFNNSGGGWVIISGDDCTIPVLGYSESGTFTYVGMPDNVRWWFNRISGGIGRARSLSLNKPTEKIRNAWQNIGVRTKASGGKLIQTANWAQDSPYNKKCPSSGGEVCVTGCVATAMAIVLRHHQWPSKGKGTVPAYKTETLNISVAANNVGTHTYNWSQMPLTDGAVAAWSSTQKEAVSQLIFDLGTSVQMDYDPEGSGAYSSNIVPALSKYFSYSASARDVYRSFFQDSEWLNVIKAEIDADRPVIYGGCDEDGSGHQFVCDGYDDKGNIHINWGWGGAANGYFPVCKLGDRGTGRNDVGYIFNYEDSAVIGIVKDENGTQGSSQLLCLSDDEGYVGISLASGTIEPGKTFTIDVGYICNYGPGDYKSSVKAGLVDRFGKLKEFIGAEKTITLLDDDDNWYDVLDSYSCKINGTIAPGDGIEMFYKLGDGSWAPIGGFRQNADYNSRTYEFTGKTNYYPLTPMGVFDIPMIYVEDSYVAGSSFYFSLIYGQKHVSSVSWYFDGQKTAEEYATLTAGKHSVKAVIIFDDRTTTTVTATVNAK